MLRSLAFASTLIACFISASATALQAPLAPPPVQLAEVYHPGDAIDLGAYRVSEKYDGVRAWWDGRQLRTRAGNIIAAPAWFTAGLPATTLEGELWGGRGRFEKTSGILRQQTPDSEAWRSIHYCLFDLPAHGGTFDERYAALGAMVQQINHPWVIAVEQVRVQSLKELQRRFDAIVAAGAEGLMLHRGDSLYSAGRSRDLLKYKPYDDAEARVIEYLPGKGKYSGLMGALRVERKDGLRFAIGGGFSDEQRRHPPALGSNITYTYNGLTAAGLPRFARFLRVRQEP